jgi:hypothetical protein
MPYFGNEPQIDVCVANEQPTGLISFRSSEAARCFAFHALPSTAAYRELRRQEKKKREEKEDTLDPLLVHSGLPVLRGGNKLLLLHGQHCFFCLVTGRAAPI